MRYFLDTEFNGFGGDLISIALVGEDGRELYLATECIKPVPWVAENVMPIMRCTGARPVMVSPKHIGPIISSFLFDHGLPMIVADWPDDVAYFCRALIVGPGQMVDIASLHFEIVRVDVYPTELPGAIQHNALWDARALRREILG